MDIGNYHGSEAISEKTIDCQLEEEQEPSFSGDKICPEKHKESVTTETGVDKRYVDRGRPSVSLLYLS